MDRRSRLRTVPIGAAAQATLPAKRQAAAPDSRPFMIVAPPPDLTGEPGERVMDCIDVIVKRGGRKVAVAIFAEVGTGHIARKWYEIPESPAQSCKFWRDVALALGAHPRAGELVDPRDAFVGRRFRVRVGYRKTPGVKGGGRARDELAGHRKDGDFLRVHDLLERLA